VNGTGQELVYPGSGITHRIEDIARGSSATLAL